MTLEIKQYLILLRLSGKSDAKREKRNRKEREMEIIKKQIHINFILYLCYMPIYFEIKTTHLLNKT